MQEDDENSVDCCSGDARDAAATMPVSAAAYCPQTGRKGQRVDGSTVKAMLAVSLQAVRDTHYYFCKDADCPIVYFSEDGTQQFTTEQLRERVYQKASDRDDTFICYCFRFTAGHIRNAAPRASENIYIESINAGIQAGQCACDIRNPQGTCCLGNVHALIKATRRTHDA